MYDDDTLTIEVLGTAAEVTKMRSCALAKQPRVSFVEESALGSVKWETYTAIVVPATWRLRPVGAAAKAAFSWLSKEEAQAAKSSYVCPLASYLAWPLI